MSIREIIDLSLPENPTAADCLRQLELMDYCNTYLAHQHDRQACECKACSWVNTQLLIERIQREG